MADSSQNKFHDTNHFGKGLSKLEIAEIQINDAIKILFDGFHPISVHTVISGGYQIVRDLAEKAKTEEYLQITDHIKEGYGEVFWGHINKAWNFFKHADRDSEALFDGVNEMVNDFAILMSIRLYKSLEQPLTKEMVVFSNWFLCLRPELIHEGPLRSWIESNVKDCNAKQFSRREMLAAGKVSLENALNKTRPDGTLYEF